MERERIQYNILPLLRLFCLVLIVWGVMIYANYLYLHYLFKLSSSSQSTLRYIFSIFKVIWSYIITSRLFDSNILLFGLTHEDHNSYLRRSSRYGKKIYFIFILNTVSVFLIPIITQMCIDPACFNTIFFQVSQKFIQ